MTSKTYVVPNISCSHCTHTIERELELVEGVESVQAAESWAASRNPAPVQFALDRGSWCW